MPDIGRILRFAFVGGAVAVLYVLLYMGFLGLGLVQWVANGAAFMLAVTVQYVGQAGLTFAVPLKDRAQVIRFLGMIGCGFVTSALVTGVLGPLWGLEAWQSAMLVTVILPIQNYLIMTRWVFARRAQLEQTP